MPIPQSRLIATVAAGEHFQRILTHLGNEIANLAVQVRDGETTGSQAFRAIALSINSYAASSATAAASLTLALERTHFHHTRARNERLARKRAAQRLAGRAPEPTDLGDLFQDSLPLEEFPDGTPDTDDPWEREPESQPEHQP